MPRARDPNREKAFELWKEKKGEITNRALAEQLGVPEKTIGAWKSKDKWVQQTNGVLQTNKRSTPKKKEKLHPLELDEDITLDNFLEDSELTEKQRIFCLYYVRTFNATQSAINAGYSSVTAHVQGSRLLTNVKVREEIKRIKQAMTNELFIEAVDVLNKYIKIAFSDITDYLTFGQREVPVMSAFGPVLDEEGNQVYKEVNYVDFKDAGFVDGTIISEVKQGKDGVSIKLEDRKWALDKLDRYFDILPDQFKRKVEEEKLKLAREKLEFEKLKATGEDGETEDDGFLEALQGKVDEVWDDAEED
ncbi:terminase small subunit [Mesobacillus stamsii]|uniref:Phage terminase small subunit n=1 Tax=Mesobacillus stamsii TaxID=225347 RepID=A0ABU0FS23_9BACI|nr:terminase small subunit [Mesobacillus stamsii]MDQ0412711.1 phage terminase small subunit [Mesobacillus stamsii]